MKNKKLLLKFEEIFKSQREVKVAYLFGSQAKGDANENSDYDFAIYLNSRDKLKNFKVKASLLDKLSRLLKTDNIDIVVLDDTLQSELKYNIIQEGIVLCEKEPHRILIEPRILNEYFDFSLGLKKNNLTKADIKI